MANRSDFIANGGAGYRRRGGQAGPLWPGLSPTIQAGVAQSYPPEPTGARENLIPPPDGRPIDPSSWHDQALIVALGIEVAMANPHIRMLTQTMLDNMARATFKPHVQPPWITKPFMGQDFGGNVSMTAVAGAGFTTFTQVGPPVLTLAFTMPQGRMGVLKEFAQGALSPTDWDDLCWRLTLNGTPLFPWNNVCCQMGMLQSPRQVQIILNPGDTIALQVINNGVANILNVEGWLYGWNWPVPSAGDVLNAQGQATVA